MFVPRKKSPQARLSRERYRAAIKVNGGGPRLDLGGGAGPGQSDSISTSIGRTLGPRRLL